MDKSLINKTYIITGASSGMGRATAVRFAQEGANLHGEYFGGKSCTALVRTDGGVGYLCAACWPMELGPSDFILPTI